MTTLRSIYGDALCDACADIREALTNEAEAEVYDKMEMIPPGEGVRACGVFYRLFTDASGLGLAEQAGRLRHPDPPKREEELAERVEM